MRSDSPYDRLGATVETALERKRATIIGDASIFYQAHRGLGEWREWRGILDETEDTPPWDLRARDQTPSKQLLRDFETIDGLGVEGENLTTDTGIPLELTFASPELSGEGELIVEDAALGEYTLAFKAPGDTVEGEAVALTDASWENVDDGDPVAPRVLLESDGARFAVDLEISRDLWLILWLGRTTPVTFAPLLTQDELTLPGVTLG